MDRLLELTSQAEASHFWFRGFRQFVTPLLARATAGRARPAILDCGCGTGYNLHTLLDPLGVSYGMDVTATGLELARRAGRPLVRADATRIPFRTHSFDIVTSFDMLQCVADDRAALAEIARVLRPGGHLVGSVAALEVLHGDHSVLSEEVRRYDKRGLIERLERAGLMPERVRYAFASVFPVVLGVRLLQRARGAHATGREIAVPPGPINAVLTGLVSGEAALARVARMPFGSSLVFLAKKADPQKDRPIASVSG
jgi:ubiquinone/menaquinone biosynthesis C-methylase UbiE